MLFNVIAVVLGLFALIVYVTGVRNEKSWGAPAMILLVLGALAVLVVPKFRSDRERRGLEDRVQERRHQKLEMLGGALAPRLSTGARVLLIGRSPQEEEALKTAFERGVGFEVAVDVDPAEAITHSVIGQHNARGFNAVIDPYRDRKPDLIISLVGLPVQDGLGSLSCFDWEPAPLFAADVEHWEYTPRQVQHYIETGLLAAVLLRPGRDQDVVVVDADNTEVLRDVAP